MAKTAAELKADIKTIRDQMDAEITKYADKPMPDDIAAQCMKWDVALGGDKDEPGLLARYSEAAQREQKAKNNREAMANIFGGDDVAAPTGDGDKRAEGKADAAMTLGDRLISDLEFKAWHDNLTAGGTREASKGVAMTSPTVNIRGKAAEMKALITGLSSTSGGALVVNDRTNILVPAVRDDLRVVDLLTRMTTNSDVVEFVRVGTETNAAAGVLEATSINDGAKPESSVTMAVASEIVETIAHFVYITRRAFSDAGQLRAYVNEFLMWGLLDKLNDEIINGTGTTPSLRGIDDLSGHQTQAFSTNLLETTRKARTLVKTVGGARPTAYVLTPENWETIDLLQDNENRYYFGGPMAMGNPTLWGLPVVEEEAVDANKGFVGDWRQGIIFDREQANILISDSNRDLFERNILTILAEMRAAIAWLRPSAFVEIAMA